MIQRDTFFTRPKTPQEEAKPAAGNVASAPRPTPEEPHAPAKNAESQRSQLIVGPNIRMKGVEIADCDTLVVEGHVEATMDSRIIQIAAGGSFSGVASIDNAEIHGTFSGELKARKSLTVHATGKVSGKIQCRRLIVEDGGELNGEITSLAEADVAASRVVPSAAPKPATVAVGAAALNVR
jgi:cytoskeletal protein CcmA (bactofilin family)